MTIMPGVLISKQRESLDTMLEPGITVPEEIGFLDPNIDPRHERLSGFLHDYASTAATGIDIIEAQIRRYDVGMREVPGTILMGAHWSDGMTIRPADVTAATTGA